MSINNFQTELVVKLVHDFEENRGRPRWKLMDNFYYRGRLLTRNFNGQIINKPIFVRVPRNFVTDFASVPRLPLVWLLVGGVGIRASIIHDYLYRTGNLTYLGLINMAPISRKEADRVFYSALRASKICRGRALLMYLGVRLFGGRIWSKYRKDTQIK